MKTNRWIALLLPVAAGAAVWALAALSDGDDAPPRSVANDRRAVSTSAWEPLPRDAWGLGERRTYAVALHSTIVSQDQGAGARQSFAMDGAFTLSLSPFAREADRTSIRVELRVDALRRRHSEGQPETMPEVAAALEAPFAVTVQDSGAVEYVYLDPKRDMTAQGIAQAILSALQLVQPAREHPPTWSTAEVDSSGEYTAVYRRTAPLELQKTKLSYKSEAQPAVGLIERDRSGSTRFTLAEGGIPRSIETTQDETTSTKAGSLEAKTRIELALRSVEAAEVQALALIPAHAVTLAELHGSGAARTQHDEELARGHSVSSVVREIEASDRDDPHRRAGLMERLAAVLRLGGVEAAQAAAQAVRATEADEDARLAMGALEGAGGPEALGALMELAKDPELSEDRRVTALMHLGLASEPVPATLEGLQDMADDGDLDPTLRETALLALGGALRNAEPLLVEGFSASVDYLLEKVVGAATVDEKLLALDALGNSGSLRALHELEGALLSDAPQVRAAAASGLRHLDGPEADTLIATTARLDEDSHVRRHALGALRYRDLTEATQKTLLETLREDEDPIARVAAVEVMAVHLDEHQKFAAALESASENDQDPQVRERALAALSDDRVVRH